jgi:hypothetical protein
MLVSWVVTLRGRVGFIDILKKTYTAFILRGEVRWRQYISPKCCYLPAGPHIVSAQATNTDIFTAMKPQTLYDSQVIK